LSGKRPSWIGNAKSGTESQSEKSADQMDEIQYASERELAMRNVTVSPPVRQVKAALRRIHDGSFGTCAECEIGDQPKRLAALPWRYFASSARKFTIGIGRREPNLSAGSRQRRGNERWWPRKERWVQVVKTASSTPNHCVSRRLLAAQMRALPRLHPTAWRGGGSAPPEPVLRGAGQRHEGCYQYPDVRSLRD